MNRDDAEDADDPRAADARIDAGERALAQAPDRHDLREALLLEYARDEVTVRDPRRIGHIRWFIRHRPGDLVCQSPLVHLPSQALDALYASLTEDWERARTADPGNVDIITGMARFVATRDQPRALGLLREALGRDPDQAGLRLALGRLSPEPAEQLEQFQIARRLGAPAPNLLVWIARSAADAADHAVAETAARELLDSVETTRAQYGDMLEWPTKGGAAFRRACRELGDHEAASALVSAIAECSYRTHWAHTVLGLVAIARAEVDAAVRHLHESARVAPDYRLSSYGPSIALARALCAQGEWDAAAVYFERWHAIWSDARPARWQAQVARRELPDDPDGSDD